MKILMVGGGSGGHVTPVAAVIREIKDRHPKAEIRFWCDRKFYNQARSIINNLGFDIKVEKIQAGKFRRYHHLSIWKQITWLSLVLANLKDGFLVILGFFESFVKLIFWRPDVVFTKGGYVCLPVGMVAKMLKIPLVIHDSDAHPGLTNRILSKYADAIGTGAPLEYYPYPKAKSVYTGIPISSDFKLLDSNEQMELKQRWGISQDYPLVVVTGGGLGAIRINDTIAEILKDLLGFCSVVLVSGVGQYDELRAITPPNNDRFQLHSFISSDMAGLLGAADVVVARAGATTILELCALEKATILIPNAKLTGGHQIKNTEVYLKNNAVIAVDEDLMLENHEVLLDAIKNLILNPDEAKRMASRLHEFSKPQAASDMADMILAKINKR